MGRRRANAGGGQVQVPQESVLLQNLPEEIRKKIGKAKQTRGAQPYERVVYQSRVNRNGIAVVPYKFRGQLHPDGFENGYVIMVRPEEYFSAPRRSARISTLPCGSGRTPSFTTTAGAVSATSPHWGGGGLGPRAGRERSCTDSRRPRRKMRGAAANKVEGEPQGIRFFEYASSLEMYKVCVQLALLAWTTDGLEEALSGACRPRLPRH
jgi:BstXI restriction endonuclease